MEKPSDIHEHEARQLIIKLINFLGANQIERCLENYKKSLVAAGPVYKEYYLKHRHPWWEALIYFFELERKGKSIKKNLDLRLKLLAGDARKISILQKLMPAPVREKFKKDLIDKKRAFDFLFELKIAWHHYINGNSISWYEEDGCPDFLVKTPSFDFNVECKRVTVDGSRKVWRRDFYRLVEILLPQVQKLKYKGTIDIVLKDRLHSNNQHLEYISKKILKIFIHNGSEGGFEMPLGEVFLKLRESDGEIVDLTKKYQEMLNRKSHESHGAIFANDKNGKPVDPVELTIKSEKSDKVLEGVKDKIKKAATKQLPPSKPGIISCFLEDIDELKSLASDSRLQLLSRYLLEKKEFSHVAAISFCAEGRFQREQGAENFNSQGLLFRNPNCIYEKAQNFPFLSKEIEEAELANH